MAAVACILKPKLYKLELDLHACPIHELVVMLLKSPKLGLDRGMSKSLLSLQFSCLQPISPGATFPWRLPPSYHCPHGRKAPGRMGCKGLTSNRWTREVHRSLKFPYPVLHVNGTGPLWKICITAKCGSSFQAQKGRQKELPLSTERAGTILKRWGMSLGYHISEEFDSCWERTKHKKRAGCKRNDF